MSSKVLAHPPGDQCCTGVKHSGDAVGNEKVIGGTNTYVSLPPAGQATKGVILFYADVYGPLYINNKLIQDYFASQGFIVTGIDYFEGDPIHFHDNEKDWDRGAWFNFKKKRAKEIEPEWFAGVKAEFGSEHKFFAVGYCFGAPFVCESGASDKIAAGAIAHPAFLDEDHFKNLRAPLLLSCAEVDGTFDLEHRRRAEDILVEDKKTYHFQVFSGVKHGFAVRGNPDDENERWAKEQSAKGIMDWFVRFSK